jgi:hypothetical protein
MRKQTDTDFIVVGPMRFSGIRISNLRHALDHGALNRIDRCETTIHLHDPSAQLVLHLVHAETENDMTPFGGIRSKISMGVR